MSDRAILTYLRTAVGGAAGIDEVREYWDRQPCNVKYSTHSPGSLEWSREVMRRKDFVGPHIPKFAQFNRWRGKNVLEIGCGIGSDTLRFLKAGAYVKACDVSEESLELTRKRCRAEMNSQGTIDSTFNLNTFHCNAEEYLPDVNGGFDLVYSFGVLHHTPNPEKVLELAYERMKPGAELRIMLYAKWSIKNLTHQQPEAQPGCPIVKTYTARSVRKLLKKFIVTEIRKEHIFLWRVKDYIEHRYVAHWYYRWMPKTLFRWLEHRLGWHLLITAVKPSIPCHGEEK